MVDTCTATAASGGACNAQAWRDGLCRWHHPDLAEERAGWRRKGGENRSTANRAAKRLPKDLRDVRDALLRALRDVESGDLEPARANAMGALARSVVAVHQVAELESRLVALEEAAGLGGERVG